jgi:hypothetical protein
MSTKEFQNMYKLRFDDAGKKVYMLPQDVIDNSIRAFSVSATSPTGYGALGVPTGRYLAPANGPDCIDMTDAASIGNPINAGTSCGVGSLVTQGPLFWTTDLNIVKRIRLKGQMSLEFRAELLNAFNHANFVPIATASSTATNYEVTQTLDGVTTGGPRVAQLVARFSW